MMRVLFCLLLLSVIGCEAYKTTNVTISKPFRVESVEYKRGTSSGVATIITAEDGAIYIVRGWHSVPSSGTEVVIHTRDCYRGSQSLHETK